MSSPKYLVTALAYSSIFLAGYASANDLGSKLAGCVSISSAVARLDCFDKIASEAATAPAGALAPSPDAPTSTTSGNAETDKSKPPSDQVSANVDVPKNEPPPKVPEGDWLVSDDTDPITDKKNITLMLPADNYQSGDLRNTPVLVIRCKNNRTEIYVTTHKYLGSDGQSISYRLDARPARTEYWTISTSGTALFSTRHIAFIKEIMDIKTLLMEVRPYRDPRMLIRFDLTGLPHVIKGVQTLCNWR